MAKIIIKNGTIATFGPENKILKDHVLVIDGEKIAQITKAGDAPLVAPGDRILDAQNKLVLPGFINTHTHFYSAFARGLKTKPAKNFTEILNNLWWRLDKKLLLEDVYASALVSCCDAIKKGTTTVFDHHASPGAVKGSLDQIAKATQKVGIKAALCYELSDRDGKTVSAQGITENQQFLERCQSDKSGILKGLFGLHASFTLRDQSLRVAQKVAEEFEAGFHVHVAEDKSDQKITLETSGLPVAERLANLGILGPKTLCAHGIHLSDHELDIIKKHDAIIIHNPQSNMNNGVGTLNLQKLADKDILFGLGTDAMTHNMLEELRSALWLQNNFHKNPSAGFDVVTKSLFINNAEICQRFFPDRVGVLAEGAAADVILMDYRSPTEMTSANVYGHAVFGFSQATVDTTIINGKIVMENKKLRDIDEDAITQWALECSRSLWQRL